MPKFSDTTVHGYSIVEATGVDNPSTAVSRKRTGESGPDFGPNTAKSNNRIELAILSGPPVVGGDNRQVSPSTKKLRGQEGITSPSMRCVFCPQATKVTPRTFRPLKIGNVKMR